MHKIELTKREQLLAEALHRTLIFHGVLRHGGDMDIRLMLEAAPTSEDVALKFPPELLPCPFRVKVTGEDQSKQILAKLYSLGFGYFNGSRLVADHEYFAVCGFAVSRKGAVTCYLQGEDEAYFENDVRKRLVSADLLLSVNDIGDLVRHAGVDGVPRCD